MTEALDLLLLLLAGAYAWTWRAVRRADPSSSSVPRLWAFLLGVGFLWAGVASPIARLDQGHLTGHMIQHLLIMTLAAPLLLLGEPIQVFYLAWLPARSMPRWHAPHPALCWIAGTVVVLVWHVPTIFAFGMRWHGFQHATFLVAGLLFWLPVIQPQPIASHWPRWSIPLYLFLATLPCDGLSAFLAFCGRVVYPQYGAMPAGCTMHLGGISPLEDQARAGALMWFWVTIAYLIPAVLVTIELLSPRASNGLAHRIVPEPVNHA